MAVGELIKKVSLGRIILWFILTVIGLALVLSLFLPLSPTRSIARMIWYAITGRLHFPTNSIGEVVFDKSGKSFTVFREVVVDPEMDQPKNPGATLVLHFRVSNMTPAANELFSMLPLPLYLGDPGFRSKLFTIHGEYCQSIYQWDTAADARAYVNSMAVKMVSGRSVPGSFSYEILENDNWRLSFYEE